MKSFIISSNGSGKGKTTITLGILKAFKDKGFKVQSYKIGPDYIDGDFHQHITGMKARNLDLYLMGEDGVKASFSRGHGDIGVIEGAMGLYDGKGISSEFSTAHVAKVLNLPVILVLSPKAKVATICAEINGLMNFEPVNIAGIILNNINESYYKLLKLSIEKYCKIQVLGYVPKTEELTLKSRHLGLVQSSEIENLDKKIDICSQMIKKHSNKN
jgi:cobyrinic acid a,c-diamide synthase